MVSEYFKDSTGREISIISAISAVSLAIVGVLGFSVSASASEMAPIIEFDRNVLASSVVHSELGVRLEENKVTLDPAPLSRVMTTSRPGYSFGGWSYRVGEAAVTTLVTASHTTTRMTLYAVWNTKLSLDSNGATAGRLPSGQTTIEYRFGQDLVLPSSGTVKKKGFSFGGWTLVPNSGQVIKSYRAAGEAAGNPTVYASWVKTINFKSKGSVGTVPTPITIFEGGARVALPTASQVTLTRSGYTFMGWSTTPKGKVVKKSTSYLPKTASVTLHAVWKKN